MAAITNYSTLVQAIKDEAEDDGTEFADFIPVAIDLAEERLFRELDFPELEEKETGNTVPNVATLVKPAGYEFAEYLMLTLSSTRNVVLKKKQESFIRDYWPGTGVTDVGAPKYYADESITTFILAPTPESNYGYELKYTKKPTKLSMSNSTNYYVDNCPGVLFAAAMHEMVKFMKSWSQVPVWEQDFKQLREGWNMQQARFRRDGGSFPLNMDTGPNSIKHTNNSNS